MEKIKSGKFVFAEAFPSAPDSEKEWFAKQEGWDYAPSAKNIVIGDYLKKWDKEILEQYESSTKKFDYKQIIKCWIEPYFGQMTFYELTRFELKKFIGTLKCKIGKNKGETLSRARMKNIITIIRTIYTDAADQYHWESPDPFRDVKKHITKNPAKTREIFHFDEWMKILAAIPVWHRPMIEFMMLTGMIHSEISGLLRSHIHTDHIFIQQSIVRKEVSPRLKNEFRIRKFPLTRRNREILDEVLARTDSPYVFARPDGRPYLRENFTERTWKTAIRKCEIPYRPPYSIRHSFVAWSLLGGIDPIRLVKLMGHGSKKMIYEVYGDYTNGLENNKWDIIEYLGKDFFEAKKRPLPFHYNSLSESFGESQGSQGCKQLFLLNN